MPDALSKTIPIWCCVLNRTLFPDQPAHHDLYVPPNAVSASEKSQMLARIPEGVEALRLLKLDLDGLRAQISKPLRPTWVTPETDLSHYHHSHHRGEDDGAGDGEGDDEPGVRIFDDFRPVICCTSSKRVTDGEMSGHTGYIQGAGDDTENWAHGLTPPVFWAHADELLSTHEADSPDTITRLVTAAVSQSSVASPSDPPSIGIDGAPLPHQGLPPTVRRLTPYLYVSPLPIPSPIHEDNNPSATSSSSFSSSSWCRISLFPTATAPETWVQSPTQLNVGLGKHKAASRNLRVALANICDFVTRYLQQQEAVVEGSSPSGPSSPEQPKRVLIACETGGRDLSIGVALALLCWCFADDDGRVPIVVSKKDVIGSPQTATASTQGRNNDGGDKHDGNRELSASSSPPLAQPPVSFNKAMIKVRLGRIMTAMPHANPNRATLQSVNSFLMDWRK